ncbi:hypothetical protein [Janthinobacterium sp.]|nr:hypothetical protein [Janthinobacterium sp.]
MKTFIVTVFRLDLPSETYLGTGTDSAAMSMAAQDKFGPCGVSVNPT